MKIVSNWLGDASQEPQDPECSPHIEKGSLASASLMPGVGGSYRKPRGSLVILSVRLMTHQKGKALLEMDIFPDIKRAPSCP